jgi:F-type H+-transporting ATPase subunit epsilon
MARIQLEIITPEAVVLEETVDEVILPGAVGEIGVLPGHLPLMTTLGSGRLIAVHGTERHKFVIHGGFAEILPGKVVILTGAGEPVENIDIDRAKKALAAAEAALREAEGKPEDQSVVEAAALYKAALSRARARILIAEEGE